MNLQQVIDFFKLDPYFSKNIRYIYEVPKKNETLIDFPEDLDPRIINALEKKNIHKLYLHQYDAYKNVVEGKNVLLTTSTASGKTLAFILPVLNLKIKNPDLRVLMIYPTKALSRDQENWIKDLGNDLGLKLRIHTYDGDTSQTIRRKIREAGDFVITNPDMLHSGILSKHTSWIQLFENLSFVIIDEVHVYKGIFGSHFANVLRRLFRITDAYKKKPQIISASATIGNPKELIQKLTEKEFVVIDQDSSRREKKVYFLYNVKPDTSKVEKLTDTLLQALELADIFLKNDISCIIFCRSRKEVELLTNYLKEKNPSLEHKIDSYRSGYLPEHRREIERKLREKEITIVVSTNALELGIDIGSLEASISVGYPGSIHSFLQQSGRAGRKAEISLSILVASQDRMDQYIVKNPQFLFEKNPENVRINPDNFWIVMDHFKCSISEKPFEDQETFGNYPNSKGILEYFLKEALVVKRQEKYFWCGEEFPQKSIGIRGGPKKNVVILDITKTDSEEVLGEMDYYSARLYLHPQAIYLHQTETYFVEELLLKENIAKVKKIKTDYYTEAEEEVKIKALFEENIFDEKEIQIYKGDLRIITKPTIFKKIKFTTKENIGWGEIFLPEEEMQTQGFWILFDPTFFDSQENIGTTLLSMSYAISINAAVLSCSEINDIRCVPFVYDPIYKKPVLYIYDNFPGGLEISYFICNNLKIILEETIHTIEKCECKRGCPACIGLFYLEDKKRNYKILSLSYLEKLLSVLKNS